MSRSQWGLAVAGAVALLASALSIPPTAAAAVPAAPEVNQPTGGDTPSSTVDPRRRAELLPQDWATSDDRLWTSTGDGNGFHLLVADSATGYTWRTVATLAESGFEVDQWIGNACLTGSGRRAVVAYAPRTFTNDQRLFDGGAFVAIVDLDTGTVTKLPVLSTLSYFSPSCGAGEKAVVTQYRAQVADKPGGPTAPKTRLSTVDTATRVVSTHAEVSGEVTSAVPVNGAVVAADGSRLVRIEAGGARTPLVQATGVPFNVTTDGGEGVVFMDRTGERVRVSRAEAHRGNPARTLAVGALGRVGTASPVGGKTFVVGTPDATYPMPLSIGRLNVNRGDTVSTRGRVALGPATHQQVDAESAKPLRYTATVLANRKQVEFAFVPGVAPSPGTDAGFAPHPKLGGGRAVINPVGSPTDPIDDDRTCQVARNDARTQVYQPTARQVEWAVDQAIVDNLRMSRPANWKQSGLPAWTPQGMFPRRALVGGGRVPAQVMLGILAQESNLWQASKVALPGVSANPLIGNFYGREIYDETEANDWDIHWAQADCGYGVAQVTDGMKSGIPGALPPTQARAVALDYATNIAAGLNILIDKWNQIKSAGIQVNDGNPKYIENWFMAVWAYNSGFHPNIGGTEPWGVGWANNPVNPRFPSDRLPFMEYTYDDAAHPQRWPYPEKVIGFAGHPIDSVESPGRTVAAFRAAWWVTVNDRIFAKPPLNQFCDNTNNCQPGEEFLPTDPAVIGEPAGPCAHRNAAGQYDLKCWYHVNNTWKFSCSSQCGNELWRFDTTYPEQPDGISYAPNCSTAGLPAGALIIDDVADSVPSVRPNCGHPWTNAGTFGLTFAGSGGLYPSKVDFHQIGGGFGGHFWFGHTRKNDATGNKLKVTGTWTLGQTLNGWARVMVHMPDHGAHTQQARYAVSLGNGVTKTRMLLQRVYEHRWVPLGVFQFAGVPKVTLSTETYDGRGDDDVAFDAIAFQPLAAKPRNMIVSLGDSYASGEGASVGGGGDYYRETDNNGGDDAIRNACHRSKNAWSRKAILMDVPGSSIGARADSWSASMDHHLIACSGATTDNLLPYHTVPVGLPKPTNAFGKQGLGQYGEVSQLDKGFLDENTTLVTLAIGGNDARFSDIIKECIYAAGLFACQDAKLSGDSDTVDVATRNRVTGPVKDSIVLVLREIKKKAPNAKIMLMGYPKLMENSGSCVIGIGTSEADWLNNTSDFVATHMNDAVVRARAEGINAFFSNPISAFLGQAICGSPENIHNIVLDKTPGDPPGFLLPPSNQSFHPKNGGTTLYANAMNGTLRTMGL